MKKMMLRAIATLFLLCIIFFQALPHAPAAIAIPVYTARSQLIEKLVKSITMKMRKKSDLPSKTCQQCGLPFTWRKKWEKDWEQVKYCSDRCRRDAKGNTKTSL